VSEIDPQTVLTAREIARAHLKVEGATVTPADIVYAVKAYFGDGLDADTLQSWCLALRDELSRANVTAALSLSWPDEQQPAETTGGEQAQDGAAGRVMADLLSDGNPDLTRYEKTQLRAVLAERNALAARVAELEAHPVLLVRADREADEADVQAVAALLAAQADGASMAECKHAFTELRARFADRIEALDAAALARAESATVLPERWRALIAERDEARELARVSLDILRNVSDEPMRELFEVDDMDEMPGWFTGYGKPSAAKAPDATQEARSATLRAEDGVQASGSELEFGRRSAGLSEPERPREADSVAIKLSDGEIRVPEDCPIPDGVLRVMNVMNDDTTEDDRG